MDEYLIDDADVWDEENAADMEALLEMENQDSTIDKNVFESKTQYPRNPLHVLNQGDNERGYSFSSQADLVSSPTFHNHRAKPVVLPVHSLMSSSQPEPQDQSLVINNDEMTTASPSNNMSSLTASRSGALEQSQTQYSGELFPDTNVPLSHYDRILQENKPGFGAELLDDTFKSLEADVGFGWDSDSDQEPEKTIRDVNGPDTTAPNAASASTNTTNVSHETRLRDAFNSLGGSRSIPSVSPMKHQVTGVDLSTHGDKLNSTVPLKRSLGDSFVADGMSSFGRETDKKRIATSPRNNDSFQDMDSLLFRGQEQTLDGTLLSSSSSSQGLTLPPMGDSFQENEFSMGFEDEESHFGDAKEEIVARNAHLDNQNVTLTPPRRTTTSLHQLNTAMSPSSHSRPSVSTNIQIEQPKALDPAQLGKQIKARTNPQMNLDMRFRNYRFEPHTGTFLIAKSSKGTILHIPTKKTYSFLSGAMSVSTRQGGAGETLATRPVRLLATPLHKLIEQVRDMQRLGRLEAAEQEMEEFGEDGRAAGGHQGHQLMWVDKYAPKRYIDLVGDERINRSVLSWVKQWDPCVFKKEVKPSLLAQQQKQYNKNVLQNAERLQKRRQQDKYHRPEKRLLMLSGPPGLGKTTLAHIVAKHCGYNVIEVNASDDRSGESVRNKILSAIECQAVLGSKKPNLIIIDEIDGALDNANSDQSLIKLLVELATPSCTDDSATKSQQKQPSSDTTSKKGKQKKKTELLRPIICICNDLYAPVLRPLRPLAEMHAFKAPLFQDLARRLQEICIQEGIKADLRTMMSLCELTAGDMRSAIHTLQFLQKQSSHGHQTSHGHQGAGGVNRTGRASTGLSITVDMIQKLDIGSKDMSKSVFSVWEAIFSTPTAKQMKKLDFKQAQTAVVQSEDSVHGVGMQKAVVTNGGQTNGAPAYVARLETLIRSCGDTQLVLKGCFETYLKCRIINKAQGNTSESGDSLLEQIGEFLHLFDNLTQQIHASQRFEFGSYLPFPIIAFHRFFAMPGAANHLSLEYPRQEMQVKTLSNERLNVLSSFRDGFRKEMRVFWGNRVCLVQELIPFLLPLTAPELKPSNPQLMKENEKQVLQRLVKILVSFGLRLIQFFGESGRPMYRLDPPLEKLACFDGKEVVSMTRLSYPTKQLISSEVEKEHIRHIEMSKKSRTAGRPTLTQPQTGRVSSRPDSTSSRRTASSADREEDTRRDSLRDGPSSSQDKTKETLVPKAVTLKPVRDFFGRIVETVEEEETDDQHKENKGSLQSGEVKVTFVYHEGFSNAVRKPVLIADFL